MNSKIKPPKTRWKGKIDKQPTQSKKGILPWLISSWSQILFLIIGIFAGWILGTSKKDVNEIVSENFSSFQQEFLKTEDYKEYLNSYKKLYSKSLESLMPGGYLIFGERDNKLILPDNYTSNDFIIGDITGTAYINANNITVDLYIGYLELRATEEKGRIRIGESKIGGNPILNYRIGELYQLNSLISRIQFYLVVCEVNDHNPVFIIGFKENVDPA